MRYLFFLVIVACGIEPSNETVVVQEEGVGGDIEQQFIVEIKPLTDRFCLKCHSSSSFLQSGAAFKASSSQTRIKSGNMPQVGSAEASAFDAVSRDKLLNF